MNVVLAGINLWFIRKLIRDRHDLSAYDVLEVGLTDAYLQHLLRVHADDIRKFFPDSPWMQPADGRSALLVERGDETVGVVIVCDAGNGVAQVELDYDSLGFHRDGKHYVLDLSDETAQT